MPGPYIKDSHYVYGKPLQQPYPAYYNSCWYHRNPPRRYLSDMLWFLDDGTSYTLDNKPAGPNDRVNRGLSNYAILNIETVATRSLRIKLYALKEEDDIDITLEIGKMYDIIYVTEGGLKLAHGILKLIDETIPDTCTRYIDGTPNTAWIAMDCSTTGVSDKRKIYVASIRNIQEVTDEDYITPVIDTDSLTDSQKLDAMVDTLGVMNSKLDKIITDLFKHDSDIKSKLDKMKLPDKLDYIMNVLTRHAENDPNYVPQDIPISEPDNESVEDDINIPSEDDDDNTDIPQTVIIRPDPN